MKRSKRIDCPTVAALAMMTLALPVALLDINSKLFPESPVNRFYSALAFSPDSSAIAADVGSKPIVFIIQESDKGNQTKLTYINTVTSEISLRDTCGSTLKI